MIAQLQQRSIYDWAQRASERGEWDGSVVASLPLVQCCPAGRRLMVIVQSQALISGLDKDHVSLVSGGAQIVLFCFADSFYFSSFVFSFPVFCPRGLLSALRAASFSGSIVRVHVVWGSSLWFIWCHPFGRGCCGIIAKRFICYGLGGVCILPTRPGFRLPPV